jgi:hypothetical protein
MIPAKVHTDKANAGPDSEETPRERLLAKPENQQCRLGSTPHSATDFKPALASLVPDREGLGSDSALVYTSAHQAIQRASLANVPLDAPQHLVRTECRANANYRADAPHRPLMRAQNTG